jgi:hypothetical protein
MVLRENHLGLAPAGLHLASSSSWKLVEKAVGLPHVKSGVGARCTHRFFSQKNKQKNVETLRFNLFRDPSIFYIIDRNIKNR